MSQENGLNSTLILIASLAALAGFLFGFDSSIIADIEDLVASDFHLSSWQWSEIVSSSLFGAIVGLILSLSLADRISRRDALIFVALLFILASLLSALAQSFEALLLARFLVGFCIGISSYSAPLFIAELAPAKKRGMLVLLNGLAITFGQSMAYLLGYFIHELVSWRFLLATGIIPAILLLIGMLLSPQSPRYLLKYHRREEALKTLKRIRPAHLDVSQELREIAASLQNQKANLQKLWRKPLLPLLLFGMSLGLLQQFSGINAILYYGPLIFQEAGLVSMKNAILATFWLSMINFIATMLTYYLVDRLGRRSLLLGGLALAALSLFTLSSFYYFKIQTEELSWFLFFMTTYILGYSLSLGSLFWVLIAEIYPSKFRGQAMSLASLMHWLANLIIALFFLSWIQALGQALVFSLFGALCLLALAFIYVFAPETRGISLEKIEENLSQGKRLRELGQSKTSYNSILKSNQESLR